jgi:glycosyltransferase involved in cell wall biosynthesis
MTLRRAAFLMPSDRMGGAERIVRTLAAEAAKSGLYDRVEVFVLCWSRTGTLESLRELGNVSLHYTHARSELGGVWPLIRFLATGRFSLVFSSSTHLNALASLMRGLRLLRADRVVARESTVIFDRSFGLAGAIFRGFYRLYGWQDMIVCQTRRMRDSLDRNTKGRLANLLVTLPNPLDLGRMRGCMDSVEGTDELSLVWCGRLSPIKSPDIAIRAVAELRDVFGIRARLEIIGEGVERPSLEKLADQLGVSDNVVFTGHLENPCLAMAGHGIGLVTSATEGFPNVVLEMLASGVRRVITTDCAGGLAEIPGVVVLPSNSPRAFAEAIVAQRGAARPEGLQSFLDSRSPALFFLKIAAAG